MGEARLGPSLNFGAFDKRVRVLRGETPPREVGGASVQSAIRRQRCSCGTRPCSSISASSWAPSFCNGMCFGATSVSSSVRLGQKH
jgi:hypothetical protein